MIQFNPGIEVIVENVIRENKLEDGLTMDDNTISADALRTQLYAAEEQALSPEAADVELAVRQRLDELRSQTDSGNQHEEFRLAA